MSKLIRTILANYSQLITINHKKL